MTDVKDLKTKYEWSADQAADFAGGLCRIEEFSKAAFKFLYLSLSKDENCQEGLAVLVRTLPEGIDSDFGLGLCEYILPRLNDEDFKSDVTIARDNFLEQSGALLKSEKSTESKTERVPARADLNSYFVASVNRIGFNSGALRHIHLGESMNSEKFDEFYHSDRFEETDEYRVFLSDNMYYTDNYVKRDDADDDVEDEPYPDVPEQ